MPFSLIFRTPFLHLSWLSAAVQKELFFTRLIDILYFVGMRAANVHVLGLLLLFLLLLVRLDDLFRFLLPILLCQRLFTLTFGSIPL